MKWRFTDRGDLVITELTDKDIPKALRWMCGERNAFHQPGQRDIMISLNGEAASDISPEDAAAGVVSLEEELTSRSVRYKIAKTKTVTDDDGTVREIKYPPSLKVKINIDHYPAPKITRYTANGPVTISEDPSILKDFDKDQIEEAAIVINFSFWEGDGLYSAYLKELAYKIESSPLNGIFD